MAIDVGAAASDRSLSAGQFTFVSLTNPTNATGLICEIKIYAAGAITNIEVAAFTDEGSYVMTTRGYTSLSDAAAGLNTYTAPASFTPFEIRTGDYIGIYSEPTDSGLGVDFEDTGGSGIYFVNDGVDYIPCTSQAFTKYGQLITRALSLYATGYELGNINIGDVWKDVQNVQINVGDDWKQLPDLNINIGDVWKDTLT